MKHWAMIALLSLLPLTEAMAQRYHVGMGDHDNLRHHRGMPVEKERIVLRLNQELRGQNTIKLKQELRLQNPAINPKRLELLAVKIVAKSARGRGEVVLQVGHQETYPEIVEGHPADYRINAPDTYDKIKLQNPSIDSKGKWQLHLRGKIKVKKVVLIVAKQRMRNRIVTLNVPMHGTHLRGQNTIALKRLVKQENPSLNLRDLELLSVSVLAKSKQGRGEVSLVVGHDVSYPEIIPGSPAMFRSMSPRSFSPVSLHNDLRSSQGKWQLDLRGNIKIQSIMLHLKKKNVGHGRFDDVIISGPRGRRI